MGTPAIGYDIPGPRDSLRYGETGINVIEKSHGVMAQQAISLLRDPKRLSNYSKNSLEYARQFSRDKTVGSFQKFLDYQNETKADVIIG
jgi:glycosyltransferase involved in cell wall biosynthesis